MPAVKKKCFRTRKLNIAPGKYLYSLNFVGLQTIDEDFQRSAQWTSAERNYRLPQDTIRKSVTDSLKWVTITWQNKSMHVLRVPAVILTSQWQQCI